jgi:glycopeptide antibiotics resistance protein
MGSQIDVRKTLVLLASGAYLVILSWLTLFAFLAPSLPGGLGLNLRPFATIGEYLQLGGRPMLINVVGNLLAFMPVGVLLPLSRVGPTSAGRVAFVSFGLSLLIESAQYASGRRVADVDDLLLNALGGILGFAVLNLLGLWRRPGLILSTGS